MIFNLGIGDIILTKMIFDTHNIKENFKIYKPIIDEYRDGSEEYLLFVKRLVKALFGDDHGEVTNIREARFPNEKYEVGDIDLSKYLKIQKQCMDPYIVFHTKARFDYSTTANHFRINELPLLRDLLKNFKTEKKIVILGEREISPNFSTTRNNQFTIYEDLLLLTNHNHIIDMTNQSLNNTPDWETFEKDMSYVNGADLNVGVGYGGNMLMSYAFSKKNAFFVSKITHPVFKHFERYTHFKTDSYFNKIKEEGY